MTREEAIKISKYLEEKKQKMTELERALTHIKTRADAWAVKEIEKALSQEPCDECIFEEGSKYCIEHCPHEAKANKPCDDAISRPSVVKFEGTNMACMGGDEIMKEFENNTQQHCDDKVISLERAKKQIGRWIGYIDQDMINRICISLEQLPPVNPQKSGKCKNCKYFEYDSVAKVDGIPLIVAHEICNKWGDGCKTSEDGYCYLYEPQESEDKE